MKWLQKKGGCFQEVVAMRELTVPSCVLGIAGSVITTGLYSHLENQFDDSEQAKIDWSRSSGLIQSILSLFSPAHLIL